MRTRAEGPGRVRCIVEPTDPIVLTDVHGTVIAGPVFWDGDVSRPHAELTYVGRRRERWCAGILRPDGALAWQGPVEPILYNGVTIRLTFAEMTEPESLLTAEDHAALRMPSID